MAGEPADRLNSVSGQYANGKVARSSVLSRACRDREVNINSILSCY